MRPSCAMAIASFSGSFLTSRSSHFLEVRLTLAEIARNEYVSFFVGDRIRRMHEHHLLPVAGREPCFFSQLALRCVQWRFIQRSPAHRQLPGIRSKCVTVLTHQPGVAGIVERHDGNCAVLEVHVAVQVIATARIDHFVFQYGHPWILVNDS